MDHRKRLIIIIGIVIIASLCMFVGVYISLYHANTKGEEECFRSTEWFPTATEAIEWALNDAPNRVESFTPLIYYDSGYLITRHEIIVEPTKKYSFGYDVTIIFYGVKEEVK